MNEILDYFPSIMQKVLSEDLKDKYKSLEEIRIRARKTNYIKIHRWRKGFKIYYFKRRNKFLSSSCL